MNQVKPDQEGPLTSAVTTAENPKNGAGQGVGKSSWLPGKKRLFRGFVIWLIVAGVELGLHKSGLTLWLTQQAYALLQINLPLERRPETPIVIVNLSHWRTTNASVPMADIHGFLVRVRTEYTDRQALGLLLKRISTMQPSAIGIDIDLSPITPDYGGNGALPPNQILFLDECQNLKTPSGAKIPVVRSLRALRVQGPSREGQMTDKGISSLAILPHLNEG